MDRGIPPTLERLLDVSDSAEREAAWEAFVATFSRLLLHTIRRHGGSHDVVMDRYASVLERLEADDFRRLRTWAGDGRSQFTTWLVVVVNRLCHDDHRSRYGRNRPAGVAATEARARRRKLADLVADEIQPDRLSAESGAVAGGDDPEAGLQAAELPSELARQVAALSADDQMLLTLRFRDGLSASRIATLMSLPTPFHVYRRLNQVLDGLRRALKARGIEDSHP